MSGLCLVRYHTVHKVFFKMISVPDTGPYDPYVFEPLGSESVITCTDPDPVPSIRQQKNEETPCFLLVNNFLMKTDVNVSTKSNK